MNKKFFYNLVFLLALVSLAYQLFYAYAQQDNTIIARPQLNYNSEDARDPFNSYLPTEENKGGQQQETEAYVQPPTLTVQGLIWGSNMPQAIINNKVVKIGDIIEGARIVEIDKEGVEVSYKGRSFTLTPATVGSQEEAGQLGREE
jgi:type II secretory pathway component PulC